MPRRPSILAGLTLATLATIPRTASAQREGADFDALAVRVTAGEASARKELMPIARRMLVDWNGTPRRPEPVRGMVTVFLAMAQPLTPLDQPPRENEVDWRGPAVRALRWLVAADSGDIPSLERLMRIAPYPYIWQPPEKELAHLRAAAARHATLPTRLGLAWFGLELEVGTTAGAARALARIPADSISSAVRQHLLTRLAYAEGDSTRARDAYRTGAQAIASAGDAAWFFGDLDWFASSAERTQWQALPLRPGSHATWLAGFWDRQDLEDGRMPGSRLAAQFERWRFALREFRWDLDGSVAEGQPVPRAAAIELGLGDSPFPKSEGTAQIMYDNRYAPIDRVLDDRGRLVMRHGLPTERILTPGITSMAQETLVWSRGDGQVVVSFSRPAMSGTVTRLGMLARNYPVGDLLTICRRDARLCVLAGISSDGGRNMAERIRQEFTAAREVAERTEGNPELYRKGMAGIFQAYGIAGGGVLVVMALPADALRSGKGSAGELLAEWRAVIGDATTGRIVATLDTVRRWRVDPSTVKGRFLTAYAVVPTPPGEYTVTMVAGDAAHQVGAGGRVAPVSVTPRDGRILRLSDPILGRAGSGVTWQHAGDAVSLNPTNAWTRDDEAPLYYELDGLVVGRSYAIEVEIWEGGEKAKAPETRVGFSLVATAATHRGEQLVSFKQLKPGDYRLVLRVRDVVGGTAVERSRSVAVR
ncbi:MAG: hypothetical protein IPJ11_02200 [Gemmatimonadetes bacterium]|nr:hypothetical protein [Gemmatimonadota bacterium]